MEIDRRTTDLVRPIWDSAEYHREEWRKKDVTVIMCERDTEEITRLTLESLLRFYPDIPILIVDGGSVDGTLNYLYFKRSEFPNIQIWERVGRNGHGTMLDDGIRQFITSKYVLLLDSDVITVRGGWIEEMLGIMNAPYDSPSPIYAIGTLMQVSYSLDCCSPPVDDSDICRYVHPSCSIIRRETYLTMRPFAEHGAPLVFNMKDARDLGHRVEYYPIERYQAHLSGASWCIPKTAWKHDFDVLSRPLISFIADRAAKIGSLVDQEDKDFEILTTDPNPETESIAIHFVGNFDVCNDIYTLRFRVRGEYVCRLADSEVEGGLIGNIKSILRANNYPDEMIIGGLIFTKRKLWQLTKALGR